MNRVAIWSEGLSRKFGRREVVSRVDLQVREGAITAFLGPNGAGKTTTIRLLLGLISPQEGRCEVLGRPPGHPAALAELGAMVETPSLYEHLTGWENLEITRLLKNVPKSDLDRVLTLVDLRHAARLPVRTYSLGMKQRLGIALALLGEPRLLILDEPTNGLDPAGIQEIRELVRSLSVQQGLTIFISSHILSEMEQIAEDIVVIHRGRLKYQGALEGLGDHSGNGLLVRTSDAQSACSWLATEGYIVFHEGDIIRIVASSDRAPLVATGLIARGYQLFEMRPVHESLETRFLKLLETE